MHLPALFAYLRGLRENNNKAWFVMNKPAYDILRPEFIALVSEVIGALSKSDPHVAGVDPKKALFRIYRDIRFSHDKTPYKTHFSASIADGGVKHWGPMYYLSIDADGRLHLGAGCYLPPRDVLARLRAHVVADHRGLARVLKGKRFAATFGALNQDDRLARLPKGFDPGMPDIDRIGDLLRLKSFVVTADLDLTKPANAKAANDLPHTVATTLAAAVPLNDWLRTAPPAGAAPSLQVDAPPSSRRSDTRTKRATKTPTS
jgi:uncharacterized protein (TIGR02453 family)